MVGIVLPLLSTPDMELQCIGRGIVRLVDDFHHNDKGGRSLHDRKQRGGNTLFWQFDPVHDVPSQPSRLVTP